MTYTLGTCQNSTLVTGDQYSLGSTTVLPEQELAVQV